MTIDSQLARGTSGAHERRMATPEGRVLRRLELNAQLEYAVHRGLSDMAAELQAALDELTDE